jgi:hypothetical protein
MWILTLVWARVSECRGGRASGKFRQPLAGTTYCSGTYAGVKYALMVESFLIVSSGNSYWAEAHVVDRFGRSIGSLETDLPSIWTVMSLNLSDILNTADVIVCMGSFPGVSESASAEFSFCTPSAPSTYPFKLTRTLPTAPHLCEQKPRFSSVLCTSCASATTCVSRNKASEFKLRFGRYWTLRVSFVV